MNRSILTCLVFTSFLAVKATEPLKVLPNGSQNPVTFTENKGQVSDQHFQPRPDVRFYGSQGPMDFHITDRGISYQLRQVESWRAEEKHEGRMAHGTLDSDVKVRMVLLGTITIGVPAPLVDIGYSAAQDTISVVRNPKGADVLSFHGTGFSIVSPVLEKVMEMDKGAVKILNFPQAVLGILGPWSRPIAIGISSCEQRTGYYLIQRV